MTGGPRTLVRYEGRLGAYARALAPKTRKILKSGGGLLGLTADHELSVVLCDGPTIRRLNRQWRGKDRPTDVLSFPQHELKPGEIPPAGPVGDIIVSLSVARRQAREWSETWDRHFQRLLIHSLLHLLGHDHHRPAERKRMEREEQRILEAL